MSIKTSTTLSNTVADAIKASLDDGRLYIFAGPVPDTADEALDMVSDHTLLLEVTLGGLGVDGLTFEAAVNGIITKTAAESWSGEAAFDGADAGTDPQTPSFYRFCESGDDGQAIGTGLARIQGTVGGPTSGADLIRGTDTMADESIQPIGSFSILGGQPS